MLPTHLLDFRRLRDGRAAPAFLTERDDVWLRELAAEAAAHAERPVDIAMERVMEGVAPLARRHGIGRRVVEAVWMIERRRWRTRIDSPIPPAKVRSFVFELAAQHSRLKALEMAAAQLGMTVEAVHRSLFADRRGARLLVAPEVPPAAGVLRDAYNLGLVQGLLARAIEVNVLVRAHLKTVVCATRSLGLMAIFEEADDGATRIAVSGPLALFHATVKYGRALAAWFPIVATTPGWSLDAKLRVGGHERVTLALDAAMPIPRTSALPRAFDSALEASVEKALRRLESPWRVVREAAVFRAGRRLFFPDFALECDRGRVVVEIAGFWTPEYLEGKAALLRAANVPFVMCAERRVAPAGIVCDPRVMLFDRTVDAAALIERCEEALVGRGEGMVRC